MAANKSILTPLKLGVHLPLRTDALREAKIAKGLFARMGILGQANYEGTNL